MLPTFVRILCGIGTGINRYAAPIAVTFLGLVIACQSWCEASDKKPAVLRIATYDYALPSWWKSVCQSRCEASDKKPAVLRIATYDYALPSWWESVKVDVPKDLKDWWQVRAYVEKRYGKDTGTKETWKEALKTWAIASQRLNNFPVYLAHCHRSGEEYERAAEIYTDLYELADTQKENQDWYRAYLAFDAGEMFELLKDTDKALDWYTRSAKYVGHKDSAIDYYAKRSAEKVSQLEKEVGG